MFYYSLFFPYLKKQIHLRFSNLNFFFSYHSHIFFWLSFQLFDIFLYFIISLLSCSFFAPMPAFSFFNYRKGNNSHLFFYSSFPIFSHSCSFRLSFFFSLSASLSLFFFSLSNVFLSFN